MSDIEDAIAWLVERDDGGPPSDDDLWRDSQLAGYPVSRRIAAWLKLLPFGLEDQVKEPVRGRGNPNFAKRPYDHLDDIEGDARELWRGPCRGKLKLFDCRVAAATHWLRYYEKAEGDIETLAADIVGKLYARSKQ